MATMTPELLVTLTDLHTAWYLTLKGSAATGHGTGYEGSTFGAWAKAKEAEEAVMITQEWDLVGPLGAASRALSNASTADNVAAILVGPIRKQLDIVCANAGSVLGLSGVIDVTSFATHYNLTATPRWQCLLAPDYYDVHVAVLGAAPPPVQSYFEVLQPGSGSGLGKLLVGTGFLNASSIDSTRYAGGFGRVKAVAVTGSGTVTVTGSWRKTDGTTATGEGITSVAAGDSTTTLTPPFTDALLLGVTSMSAAAGITGGTLYAEAARPAGRTNPPV